MGNENQAEKTKPPHGGLESEGATVVAGGGASTNSRQDSKPLPPVARWRNAVRDCRELSAQKKCVLFVLSTYMDAEGKAWPSQTTLGRGAGVSRRTANEAIKQAKALDLIEVQERSGKTAVYVAREPVAVASQGCISSFTGGEKLETHESVSESATKPLLVDEDSEKSALADSTELLTTHYDYESVNESESGGCEARDTGGVYGVPVNGSFVAALTGYDKAEGDIIVVYTADGRTLRWRWLKDGQGNEFHATMREAINVGDPVLLRFEDGWLRGIE